MEITEDTMKVYYPNVCVNSDLFLVDVDVKGEIGLRVRKVGLESNLFSWYLLFPSF